jgi:hypothetical protein
MMTSLSELQCEFVASLQNPSAGNIAHRLNSHPTLSALDQLSLYQTNIIATLQKALKAIYPTCLKLVGKDFFIRMMSAYIEVTPSISPDLNLYGESFADFIQQFEPANTLPYLSDVARLEWAWHSVYTSPDHLPFDFEKLASHYANGPQTIIFHLPAGAILLSTPYPTHLIFETNLDGYDGDTTITLREDETFYYLIWRHQLDRRMDVLSVVEWQVLSWIRAALTLGELCGRVAIAFPAIDMGVVLPQFVSQGWIGGFA